MFFQAKRTTQEKSQTGFTLLELLVVIALLAIVAGVVISGYGGVQEQARVDAVKFEMAELRKALLQFRRDSGMHAFPNQFIYDCDTVWTQATQNNITIINPWPVGSPSFSNPSSPLPAEITDWKKWCEHPANFWMLFINPRDDLTTLGIEEGGWNEDTHRGWNGPYLQRKSGYLDIGDNLTPNASGSPVIGTPLTNIWGIADPNTKPFVTESDGDKHLAWRTEITQPQAHKKYGRPYLLFGMDTTNSADDRIVSMANNGDYDSIGSEPCLPPLDPDTSEALDTVLCLLK